jgi:hypothetical protein
MPLNLLFGDRIRNKQIGSIEIDAFIEENISFSSEVTDYAIETGEEITDHIFNRPTQLRVRGVIPTNSPLPFRAARKQEVYEALKKIHADRLPVTVVSGLEAFPRMALIDLNFPRDQNNAAGLEFEAEFKQIRIVQAKQFDLGDVAALDSQDLASSEANTGTASPLEADIETSRRGRSTLSLIFGGQ